MGIYLIIGAAGGAAGYYLGIKASGKSSLSRSFDLTGSTRMHTHREFRYFLPLLAFHFIFLVSVLLYFEHSGNLVYKTGITITYMLFNLAYYRNVSRRLMKPLFWIQLLLILILAGLFLESSDPEKFSLENALINGWAMFMRAILVITSFSAISTELANPGIKNFLVRRGFNKLYLALQLAFSALPVMVENNSSLRSFLKNPVRSFSMIITDAENWLESFKKQNHL